VSDPRAVPLVCRTSGELDAALLPHRAAGHTIAFVPTMGALHDGHRALVEHAVALAPVVVVSIFVNPSQFDDVADLARYPKDLAADLALLADLAQLAGAAPASLAAGRGQLIVYAPGLDDVYPDGPAATIHVADVTDRLCGASRPGHFDGVATVVDALLRRVRPDVAVFGRKDHQQVVVVRRLVEQRGHDVRIVAAPTVRDPDGIALSSRNQQLDSGARARARSVPRALAAAVVARRAALATGTQLRVPELLAAAHDVLVRAGVTALDYLEVVDPERIVEVLDVLDPDGEALMAVAVHLEVPGGSVRLIDNVVLGDREDEDRLLAAVGAT
jgi:pantoate--beta-alanine ligase